MPEEVPEEIDWSVTTFEGNRRRQHQEFRALPFREKLALIEELGVIARHFSRCRTESAEPRATGRQADESGNQHAAQSPP